MYSIASSSADITAALANTGITVSLTVASILIGVVALMGLGYAVRHISRRILGRKF